MAFTVTKNKESVFGDTRVQFYTVTTDAASGSVATGLATIYGAQLTVSSSASGVNRIYINALGGGSTASAGSIGFGSCTTGDTVYLTVYGR